MRHLDYKSWEKLKSLVREGLGVQIHSGKVLPGQAFIALPGHSVDGADFIPAAIAAGAKYIVTCAQNISPQTGIEYIYHSNPAQALGELAAAYFKTDYCDMQVIGITGTNGKTTISYLTEYLLAYNGYCPGVIGTISCRWAGHEQKSNMTTPDCWNLHNCLCLMGQDNVNAACIEISSHALDQSRNAGIKTNIAVFTNLTQDHLDYHGDMQSYFEAKEKLFAADGIQRVVNLDDKYGRILAEKYDCLGYSLQSQQTEQALWGNLIHCNRDGLLLEIHYNGQKWQLKSGLVGRYNAYNLLAAQGVGICLGLSLEQLQVLQNFSGVPGRLQRVDNIDNKHIFIDYAHTPDALENVCSTLKKIDYARLILVFGCGGDRDRSKRPLMGQAAARYADIVILTSDNPRNEQPLQIMQDVLPGLKNCSYLVQEADRRQAIYSALDLMQKDDVLLIAGKGHEDYQQIGNEKTPFSDYQVVQDYWTRQAL